MNVEIGAEAVQFPEKEYINGIAVAVYGPALAVGLSYLSFVKSGWNLLKDAADKRIPDLIQVLDILPQYTPNIVF